MPEPHLEVVEQQQQEQPLEISELARAEPRRGASVRQRASARNGAIRGLVQGTSTIPLTDVLPEITVLIPAGDQQLAKRVLHVPVLHADGELGNLLAGEPAAVDFMIADGVVLKHTRYGGRSSLELLGPGDVLAPPLSRTQQLESRATSRYRAHGEVSLAVIEDRFRTAARRWPALSDVLLDRLAQQTHRASTHLAVLHIPRAEDRVLALFSELAERFGRVTGDGIMIDVELTHDLIGELIGSRRPTVSLALEELSTSGTLIRTSHRCWTLNAPSLLQ